MPELAILPFCAPTDVGDNGPRCFWNLSDQKLNC